MSVIRKDEPLLKNRVELRLTGEATLPVIAVVLADIRRQARYLSRTNFILDCGALEDPSEQVLADFHHLRDDLRKEGSDFTLTGCSPSLLSRLAGRLVGAETDGYREMPAHSIQGPHFSRWYHRARPSLA